MNSVSLSPLSPIILSNCFIFIYIGYTVISACLLCLRLFRLIFDRHPGLALLAASTS